MSKKTKNLLVGNWKMNPQSLEEAKNIVAGIKRRMVKVKSTDVVLCPPFPFLGVVKKTSPHLFLGVQDIHSEAYGAYTGEVSASQVSSLGVSHVLIGHSERRAMGESDEIVNKKVKAAVTAGLSVVLCIGEAKRDHDGAYLSFLKSQIKSALSKIGLRYLEQIIIAYEPIWAIGKTDNEAMKGADVEETVLFIRKVLADMYGIDPAKRVPILYGGSVGPKNAPDIFSADAISGLLVGRQSLVPESFVEILSFMESRK